jgi:pyruvate/2-oxoglutarate dehydrogenase complex dihydrolipoamide acyltransferase (E2) component
VGSGQPGAETLSPAAHPFRLMCAVPRDEDDARVAATDSPDQAPPAGPKKKHRSPWPWICGGLALVAIGALVWALSARSDLNDTQSKLDSTEQELASTQQKLDAVPTATPTEAATATPAPTETATPEEDNGNPLLSVGAVAAVKALYDDLKDQLGATQEDLAQTQKDLDAANQQAEQAEKDAAAAKDKAEQAGNETEKAQAEAEQARADQKAAESKLEIATGCAKAYVSAFGGLFEGDDVEAQAAKVKEQFAQIHDDCQTAFAGT